jgi:hypothetical protein
MHVGGSVAVRVYAELNDLLAPSRRGRWVEHEVTGSLAIRDVVERMGVPHTEVDLILVNGSSAGLDDRVGGGDRVSVFPVFGSLDVSTVQQVRPKPLHRSAFVLDVHLGRLARYLRMLGFDSLYRRDADDADLVRLAGGQRILLTRDRGLLKRRAVTHGYLVRPRHPRDQAAEVLRRFDLAGQITPFVRCLSCNEPLTPLPREAVPESVPIRVRELHDEFARCSGCDRVFWKGTHHRAMVETIAAIAREAMAVSPRRLEPEARG